MFQAAALNIAAMVLLAPYLIGSVDALVPCTTTVTPPPYVTRTWTSTVTKDCDGSKYPQACLHYRSVISLQPQSASVLYCPYPVATKSSDKPRPEVNFWALQHHDDWLSWIPVWGTTESNGVSSSCDKDEYPPAAFMRDDHGGDFGRGPVTNVWVRNIPSDENRGAGQIWRGLCGTNSVSTSAATSIADGEGTCTEHVTTLAAMNAMSLNFVNMPDWEDDGLRVNPCWPPMADPAFALLNEDPWYSRFWKEEFGTTDPDGFMADLSLRGSRYRNPPPPSEVPPGPPPRTKQGSRGWKRGVDSLQLDGTFFNLEGMLYYDAVGSTLTSEDAERLREFGILKCESKNCQKERQRLSLLSGSPPEFPEPTITAALDSSRPIAEAAAPCATPTLH